MNISEKAGNQREQEVLQEIRLAGGSCRVSLIARRLGVTNETVRRNVRTLEQRGMVRKVHGGVHLAEDLQEAPFQNRMDVNPGAKQRLAAATADLISDGDSVFLDIGSTTAYVATALQNHSNLFVVTNSIFVARTLATRNNNRVFLAGGELRPHDGGAFGAEALDFVAGFSFQFAVFSVGAVNAQLGFMLHDLEEANLARLAIARAQTRIIVADSGKFDRRAPISLGAGQDVDVLVCDQKPSAGIETMLAENDIELLVSA